MKSPLLGAVCACVLALIAGTTNAAVLPLETRLGGLAYYDRNLDITWAKDANINGLDTWDNQVSWAAGLTIGGVSGWRLPSTLNPDPTCDNPAGSTEYNCTGSEMGYLYYEEGITAAEPGPFSNVQSLGYWSGTETDFFNAWYFVFNVGLQRATLKSTDGFAWAVHDGDVAPLVDLSGTIKTVGGTGICAMVLASGKHTFSCDPPGVFSLSDLLRESDGTVKRQIYAHGFLPKIDYLPDSTTEAVVMTHSGVCPSYNMSYDPGFYPSSAGEWIDISGKVLLQDTQTPICAMVLANGQYMFSCDGTGNYALNIPLDNNGQFKLQVYADGFAPVTQTFDEFQTVNDVRMARAVECQ